MANDPSPANRALAEKIAERLLMDDSTEYVGLFTRDGGSMRSHRPVYQYDREAFIDRLAQILQEEEDK